jgi:hypothetical protein
MGDFTGSNFEGAHHLFTRTKRQNKGSAISSHTIKTVPIVKNKNQYKEVINKKLATPALIDVHCI